MLASKWRSIAYNFNQNLSYSPLIYSLIYYSEIFVWFALWGWKVVRSHFQKLPKPRFHFQRHWVIVDVNRWHNMLQNKMYFKNSSKYGNFTCWMLEFFIRKWKIKFANMIKTFWHCTHFLCANGQKVSMSLLQISVIEIPYELELQFASL